MIQKLCACSPNSRWGGGLALSGSFQRSIFWSRIDVSVIFLVAMRKKKTPEKIIYTRESCGSPFWGSQSMPTWSQLVWPETRQSQTCGRKQNCLPLGYQEVKRCSTERGMAGNEMNPYNGECD